MKKALHRAKDSRGGLVLESMLSIPVLFAIVLGTFYVGFYLSARSLVFRGATETLRYASIEQRFEADYDPDCDKDSKSSTYCAALTDVKNLAIEIATSSLIGTTPGGFAYCDPNDPETVQFSIPEATGTQSRVIARRDNPMEIIVKCYFRGVDLQFRAEEIRAYAFYEIPKTGTYPVTVDCNGNPEGHDDFNKDPCQCDADSGEISKWDGNTWTCFDCTSSAPLSWPLETDDHIGVKNKHGCHCPSTSYCQQDYLRNDPTRPGASGIVVATGSCPNQNSCCRCICHSGYGWELTDDGNCSCKKTPGGDGGVYPAAGGDHSTYPQAVFGGERRTAFGNQCRCVVSNQGDGAGLIPTSVLSSTGSITDQLCRAWYPVPHAEGWNIGSSSAGCACRCNGCSNGQRGGNWYGKGTSPITCSCDCSYGGTYSDRELKSDKSGCQCSTAPCDGGLTRKAWPNCKCPLYCSDPDQIANSDESGCVCQCTGEPPVAGSCPSVADNCAGGGSTGG